MIDPWIIIRKTDTYFIYISQNFWLSTFFILRKINIYKDYNVTFWAKVLIYTPLRRDHTLSSYLPWMRFLFISPQQKISSLHTGNETDSEFEVFSKRMTFWNIKSNFICFSLHTRSSSCQLGKYTRKLLLIPLIAMKSGKALDLPLSGISLNTSIVLDCMI